jgi:hypothetical protein
MKLSAEDWSVDFEKNRWQLGFYGSAQGRMAHVILSLHPQPEDDEDKGLRLEFHTGFSDVDLIERFDLSAGQLTLPLRNENPVEITLRDDWTTLPVVVEQFAAKASLPFACA